MSDGEGFDPENQKSIRIACEKVSRPAKFARPMRRLDGIVAIDRAGLDDFIEIAVFC